MASGYNPPSLPGLAGSTGTRVDSASKHIMACKVDSCMLAGWCCDTQNAGNHMHIHKHKYSMTRDELVLNTNLALNEDSSMMKRGVAYPAVVTTLGDCSNTFKNALKFLYYASHTGHQFLETKSHISKFANSYKKDAKVQLELKNMPFFVAQGYALGIAYASALSGDTVGSVLIGGMCTVMNGAFDCRAGQMLQWYFDFEENMFYSHTQMDDGNTIVAGTRKGDFSSGVGSEEEEENAEDEEEEEEELEKRLQDIEAVSSTKPLSTTDDQRKRWHMRGLQGADGYPHGVSSRKSNMAFPKPYMLCKDGTDHYGDKVRIFAKCITGARKHEMVDIMLMTQSL